MGLAGRKVKQRIPADPRNLTWADDAAKFGSSYLSKFGWDSSKGLGASGDGRTSHIKVSQKLDMLGIGATHHNEPDGIAWKQNKDFENLLKRLNEAGAKDGDDASSKVDTDGEANGKEGRDGAAEKKRKREKGLDDGAERKKTRRKCTEDKKPKKIEQTIAEVTENNMVAKDDNPRSTIPAAYVLQRRAHRARAIASKNMASKSTAAISEILGIAPTSSSSIASRSSTPSGKLASLGDGLTLETLTTSTQSVADYFRDKLLARPSAKSMTDAGTTTPVTPQTEYEADGHDTPRLGLGSFRSNPEIPQLFSSVAPKNQSSVHDSVSDTLSVDIQTKSISQGSSYRKKQKRRQASIYPSK